MDLYLKNTSNSPFSLNHKLISSSLYYDPYSNIIFNTKLDPNNISSYSLKNNSLISLSYDIEHNDQWNDLVSMYNISQDSAISINDNCFDLQNSILKSGNLLHSFTEQSDSGVDMTKSSNSSSATFMSNKYSIPTTSTMINKKSAKFSISESSLLDNEVSLYETKLHFSDKSSDNKSPVYEKNNEYNSCISPTSNNKLSLKYRKNIHYVQNNTSKTKLIPKRYIKWRKTNSCTFIHKIMTREKYKFMKTRSYPSILKHNEEQYSDTFLHSALDERYKRLSKSHTSIFSKISHFSFCPILFDNKRDISINSCYYPEKTLFKKKYTSLSKFFPTSTKISNSKYSLQNTFDGKSNNVSSSNDVKTECTDLETLKDKSLHVVLVFFFFFFLFGKYTGLAVIFSVK